MQTILKHRLDSRKVCATWVSHLLTECQRKYRRKSAQVTEPVSTCLIHREGLIISSGSRMVENAPVSSLKNMLYQIQFNSGGPVVQMLDDSTRSYAYQNG